MGRRQTSLNLGQTKGNEHMAQELDCSIWGLFTKRTAVPEASRVSGKNLSSF